MPKTTEKEYIPFQEEYTALIKSVDTDFELQLNKAVSSEIRNRALLKYNAVSRSTCEIRKEEYNWKDPYVTLVCRTGDRQEVRKCENDR